MNEEEKSYPAFIIQKLQQPLEAPIDPLCLNEKYQKGRNPWLLPVSSSSLVDSSSLVGSLEKRAVESPSEVKVKYEEFKNTEWKSKSRCSKIMSILWALPFHLYRKYLSSDTYRQYYNSLSWYIQK